MSGMTSTSLIHIFYISNESCHVAKAPSQLDEKENGSVTTLMLKTMGAMPLHYLKGNLKFKKKI